MSVSCLVALGGPVRDPVRFRMRRLLVALTGLAVAAGCVIPRGQRPAQLPSRHEVRLDRLVVRSDFAVSEGDPRIEELRELRLEVRDVLHLPPQQRPVVVYLFEDEDRYTRYMQAAFPSLPKRRAFFIGTPGELSVYAFWGEQVREDLRHEYTHGLLHASLEQVPLWLDEGLAEYFEVADGGPARISSDHSSHLAEMIAQGWRPNLKRLEQLEDVAEMQNADYREAWAWVHFLLNESDSGEDVLLSYLEDLQSPLSPPSLVDRIEREFPSAGERLTAYITTFATDVGRSRVQRQP